MQAIDIITQAADVLHDPNFVRWTKPMYYRFVSVGQRTLVANRPDTNPRLIPLLLTSGSALQSLPADGYQLLDITNNCNAAGDALHEVVTLTTKDALDAANRDWQVDTTSPKIYNFAYDERVPTHFYVTPPPSTGVYVRIKYSKIPDRITADADILEVSDIYEEAMVNFVVFKALSINKDSAYDMTQARNYLANFYTLIGQTATAVAMLSPNNQGGSPQG